MPAAMVTAYSSQMPTSNSRCGKFAAKSESPTPSVIAAVTATREGSAAARLHSNLPSATEKEFSPPANPRATPWKRAGSCSAAS